MNEMPNLPPWYPDAEAEAKPAPGPLLLVQAFANTLDLENGTDLLADLDTATAWLSEAGLLSARATLTRDDLELARNVRLSIRSLIESNFKERQTTPELAALRELAETHHPRLGVTDDGRLKLENPRRENLRDGLFELLLIIRTAQEDGTWPRLKICANCECQWAYYDRSRNQHGNWCDMAVCGNRMKNRQLRARRR